MRLVPGMTAAGTLAKLKAHLAKQGFGDIEVSMTGGYDPTDTPASSRLVEAMVRTYSKQGVGLLPWPWLAGSWPGATFTSAPLKLPAGIFGMGHGAGAHAPDEVLPDRLRQPEGGGTGRRGAIVRGFVLHVGLKVSGGVMAIPLLGSWPA